MNEKTDESRNKERPQYKGDGIAVWEHIAKNGRKYLAIKLVGHEVVRAFAQTKEEQLNAAPLNTHPLTPWQ